MNEHHGRDECRMKRWPWDYPEAILSIIGMVLGIVATVTSVIALVS